MKNNGNKLIADFMKGEILLGKFGFVEQFEEKDGMFHVKITDGFSNNAINTFDCMKVILDEVGEKFKHIHKQETDNNIFHLILKP